MNGQMDGRTNAQCENSITPPPNPTPTNPVCWGYKKKKKSTNLNLNEHSLICL